ncbi:lipid-transfer protein [Rhodococcus sp. USK13]|uniref:thiolase C-terminal domain-containing protein n=1 Tax=Rhodococcus sp. USK13 TaxID=2806442 RepID=UPI001BCF2CB5|nr:lipid-transfer protein [Rhodococcus sp. USK13]
MTGLSGVASIAAAGMTALTTRSNRSVLDQAAEATRAALTAAGLQPSDVDGIVSYSIYDDSVWSESVGTAIGAGDLSYVMDFGQGGQSACHMVAHAAMAVSAGMANTVVVFRALNGKSGKLIGRMTPPSASSEYRYSLGYTAYPQYIAMWTRRYMIETGATEADLGAVAVAARRWAQLNDRAQFRDPLTLEDYFESPYVAAPFRVLDCTREMDGAAAVIVTSTERARDLRLKPAVIAGAAWASHGFDLDMGGRLNDDTSRNFSSYLADRLWKQSGVGPQDVDHAQLYDCFTGALLQNVEGLGLAERGAAGALFASGATSPGGTLPINTNGGLLSEGYLHGMNTVAEAVWQMQGLGGERQVVDAEVGVVCSGGSSSGSAMVLTSDR